MADQLGTFIAANHRWPRRRSDHVGERLLADFLHAQRAALLRPMPTDPAAGRKRAYLDRLAPGWSLREATPPRPAAQAPEAAERDFDEHASHLARFRADTDRWPRPGSGNPEEEALATWLEGLTPTDLTPAQRALLDSRLPGWANPIQPRGPAHFRRRVGRVATFIADHGRHPVADSPDRAEATQAAFLAECRRRAKRGRLAPTQAGLLDDLVPSWAGGAYELRWYQRAADLAAFYCAHHRPPRRAGQHPGEHSLFLFLRHQRTTLGKDKATTTSRIRRRNYLNTHIPGWEKPGSSWSAEVTSQNLQAA